ncbi:uncharacterized protein EI97DRAFT_193132 [Westerdykella ornata]|uniref:AA9 family lytic polysaccharide monooxygenase n=1 Tax=Westerdykella ornata TaxID=318751 RepID=A0A6A6JCX4_WESOR|nr:uncharacterized protein EI97DRAFT_193132 [Westerdykella ornata]KAF2273039.1 hypothetical protein EI97DRAFT_193132 [Westerdykella ornata]
MRTQSIFFALAAAPAALAHTAFTNLFVDGLDTGDGVAMRMRMDPETATFPIGGDKLGSNDLACNVGGDKGVSRVQSVRDGATLSFQFRSWPNDASRGSMDPGHKGPCAVYLKKVDSAINDPGHGDGWFKVFHAGYDGASGQWCSDKLIANNGYLSIVLPKGLQGGYYLARPELLALHNANTGDPQFYTSCAQIFLQSDGDLVPESTVSIPGYVQLSDENMTFDIYNRPNSEYKLPGPPVAKLTSAAGVNGAFVNRQTSQTEGQRPAGCICENGNWCGKEVPDYNSESSCWASAENCWKQADDCWNSAGPTGNAGCQLWQSKCEGLQAECRAGRFNGPPNKGRDLTPPKKTIDVGLVLGNEGGGVVAAPNTAAAPAPKPSGDVNQQQPASTPASTPAAAPTLDFNENVGGYESPTADAPKQTSVDKNPSYEQGPAPTEDAGPAPTQGPPCRPGHPCVTVTHTVVKTEVVYVTAYAQQRRAAGFHHRRR